MENKILYKRRRATAIKKFYCLKCDSNTLCTE